MLVEYGGGEERLRTALKHLCDGGWWTEAELLVGRFSEVSVNGGRNDQLREKALRS